MADVRSLLQKEREFRRIHHVHATYSPTGTLLCSLCHLQLKSESLWEGHLRSPQHAMHLQKLRDGQLDRPLGLSNNQQDAAKGGTITSGGNKKRKANDGDDTDTLRKRSRGGHGLPEGFFDEITEEVPDVPALPPTDEAQIPSRPTTTSKPVQITSTEPNVDEDEWAAFEADIAAVEAPEAIDVVISAPALSAAEIEAKSVEDLNAKRKEQQEAEFEGDKEDAARKLEDEFEEMEGLEQRVRRLREKREALRIKDKGHGGVDVSAIQPVSAVDDDMPDDDDEDEEDDEEWDGFRLKS